MRKKKTIKIDNKEITVKELLVKEIRLVWDSIWEAGLSVEALQAQIKELLPVIAPELSIKDIDEMAPSELRTLWEAFKEVNADFFGIVRAVGGETALAELKKAFLKDLSGQFATSLKPAT